MSKGHTVEGTQAAGKVLITEIPVDKEKKPLQTKGVEQKISFQAEAVQCTRVSDLLLTDLKEGPTLRTAPKTPNPKPSLLSNCDRFVRGNGGGQGAFRTSPVNRGVTNSCWGKKWWDLTHFNTLRFFTLRSVWAEGRGIGFQRIKSIAAEILTLPTTLDWSTGHLRASVFFTAELGSQAPECRRGTVVRMR